MRSQITLTLPDDLYQQAQQWADLTQRDLSEALTDALSLVLTPWVRQSEALAEAVRRGLRQPLEP